jgi:hypothetical protein
LEQAELAADDPVSSACWHAEDRAAGVVGDAGLVVTGAVVGFADVERIADVGAAGVTVVLAAGAVVTGVAGRGSGGVVATARVTRGCDVTACGAADASGNGVTGVGIGNWDGIGEAAGTKVFSGPRSDADQAVVPVTTTTATTANAAHGAILRTHPGGGDGGGGVVTTGTSVVGTSSARTNVVGESSEGGLTRLSTWTHRDTHQLYYSRRQGRWANRVQRTHMV